MIDSQLTLANVDVEALGDAVDDDFESVLDAVYDGDFSAPYCCQSQARPPQTTPSADLSYLYDKASAAVAARALCCTDQGQC